MILALLQVKNLLFKYGTDPVIKGMNLTIDSPQLIGIIGANGCGKTTLLKNISGYLKPTQGCVTIAQKEVQKMSIRERAQNIGFVPQQPPSDFAFTCYDLIMMGRTPHLKRLQKEGAVDHAIVQEAMALTYTSHLQDRLATELSGGERQRIYIARALAQKPRILLLDEPIAHLDIKYQVEILTLLKNLSQKGILILTVLHDINLAAQFCEEIIMMKEGTIISRGKPRDILSPKNISTVFSLDVEIIPHPLTNTPYIIPLTSKIPLTGKVSKSVSKSVSKLNIG